MKPTAAQVASLERLRRYRTHPPSGRERLRLAAAFLLPLTILVALASFVAVLLDMPIVAFLLAGVLLGAAMRELAQQRWFIAWWPFTAEITDWQKVDELLHSAKEAPDSAPPPRRKTRGGFALAVGVALFALVFGLAIAAERAVAYMHDPTRNNPSDNVIILTASWCGHCMNLRRHLAESNIKYTDLDVEQTTEGRWAYTAVRGRGVPITIVGSQVIRGVGPANARWSAIDAALQGAGYSPH